MRTSNSALGLFLPKLGDSDLHQLDKRHWMTVRIGAGWGRRPQCRPPTAHQAAVVMNHLDRALTRDCPVTILNHVAPFATCIPASTVDAPPHWSHISHLRRTCSGVRVPMWGGAEAWLARDGRAGPPPACLLASACAALLRWELSLVLPAPY